LNSWTATGLAGRRPAGRTLPRLRYGRDALERLRDAAQRVRPRLQREVDQVEVHRQAGCVAEKEIDRRAALQRQRILGRHDAQHARR
jgi:hypothetical protein